MEKWSNGPLSSDLADVVRGISSSGWLVIQEERLTNLNEPLAEQLPKLLNHPRPALRCCRGFLNCLCGGMDYINHQVRVGEHGDVTAGKVNLPARRGCAPPHGNYVSRSVPSTAGHRFSNSLSRWSPRSNKAWIRCWVSA